MTFYRIELQDREGNELASCEDVRTLKSARQIAREYMSDPEYAADAHCCLILSENGETVDDRRK